MSDRIWGWTASIYVAACLLLGGASAAGAAANGVLQILALVLLVVLAWVRTGRAYPSGARPLILIVGAFLLWVLVQLAPLPQGLWTALPGRDAAAAALTAIGAAPGAMPASLAPIRTIESILWLLPPAAVFFLVLRLPSKERRRAAGAVIAVALVSVVLGAFQVMGGEDSPLRLYEITNPTSPVGFFSNKNHLATLLLCTLPLAAALAGRSAGESQGRARRHSARLVYGAVALFVGIGVAINGSMAGYALLLPAGFASVLIYRRAVTGRVSMRALAGLGALLIAFIGVSAFGPLSSEALSTKFASEPASRKVLTMRTLEAAGSYFPVGSGLGTFQQVYRTYEDPAEATRQFANHAHNDYAEVALELGLPGVLLVLLFILWWARRSLAAWRESFSGAALARASSVMIGVVLFHSIVDYPLRTSAIGALFAAACALLLASPVAQSRGRRGQDPAAGESGARHLQAD
jgi:O-antigen ligase